MGKWILNIALAVSVFVYLLWNQLGLSIAQRDYLFFTGNAFVFFMLCLFIFIKNSQYVVSFLFLSLSFNNLTDELLFDNTKFGLNEVIFLLLTLLIAYFRYARKHPRLDK